MTDRIQSSPRTARAIACHARSLRQRLLAAMASSLIGTAITAGCSGQLQSVRDTAETNTSARDGGAVVAASEVAASPATDASAHAQPPNPNSADAAVDASANAPTEIAVDAAVDARAATRADASWTYRTTCYTRTELEDRLEHGVGVVGGNGASRDPRFDKDGCLPKTIVIENCNVAEEGPSLAVSPSGRRLCCYTHPVVPCGDD